MTADLRQQQLPLAFRAGERMDLDTFVAGPNSAACEQLQRLGAGVRGRIYLWGGPASGKSHLLQAACGRVARRGQQAAYLPLAELREHGPAILDGLGCFELVALDDLQSIAGETAWEHGLFDFYNRAREADQSLLFAATNSPRGLGLRLADLASRLGWELVFHLQPLTDEHKREALIRHAEARGLELPDEVANYLLRRATRDMGGLLRWLDHIDQAQLAAQRRLSIPFIKSLLEDRRSQ